MSTPPLPPGFVLDSPAPAAAPAAPAARQARAAAPAVPALPPGFVVDAPAGQSAVDMIPGPDGKPVAPLPAQSAPSMLDRLQQFGRDAVGNVETAAALATGAVGAPLGMALGTAGASAAAILDGSFGTPQAAAMIEQAANEGAQKLTYQPRGQAGQAQTGAVGEFMTDEMFPILQAVPGLGAELKLLGQTLKNVRAAPVGTIARAGAEGTARDVAAAAVRPAEAVGAVAPGAAAGAGEAAAQGAGAAVTAAGKGAERVAGMARTATTLPRRALDALRKTEPDTPTPGTMGSAGAAGTDMATQRRALAEGLPVPMKLTTGQATRDAAQLKFEAETAKLPDVGAPLRDRRVQQNEQILRNFDWAVDQTGAEAPTLRAVGSAVDKALTEKYARDKAEVRVRYKEAEKAGEMEAPVTLASVVEHLNDSAPDAATAPLLDVARKRAVQLGLAAEDANGQLVPQPVPLKVAETFRQAINRATDFEPTNVRQSTIIKGLVDEATDGLGGGLYRQARAARMRLAQQYEDRGVIAKLLNNKRGMADRQVAFEDVFQHTILKGSLDDVRHVRRVLQTGGPDGAQAWRELQGATLDHIRTKATGSVATDSAGNRVLSPDALNKAIRDLDVDGRLDFIFGKQGAQFMRDLNDIAQFSKTVPPESAVNNSNTAMTLLAAAGDVGFTGISGIPAPVISLARYARQNMKDAALKRRISDALADVQRQAPGRRGSSTPKQAPAAPRAGRTLQ